MYWCLFCLFVFVDPFFRRKLGIPIGILPTSGAGVDDNAPYQAQELQITTLANPGHCVLYGFWIKKFDYIRKLNKNYC